MATYAIGDLQGCFSPLHSLLAEIGFRASSDRLWFVGDLVNRGPQSLEVLRFVRALGTRAISVLGNHDLHMLMVADGQAKLHRQDTIEPILDAPDRDDLLAWLRGLPLMHAEDGYAMVHAGLLPAWSIERALELAAETQAALRGRDWHALMAHMYGNLPDRWDEAATGKQRLRIIINAMTRLRICTADGRMDFSHKGRIENVPAGYMPWFDVPGRRSADTTVVCGHWSALGLYQRNNLIALDTGCVWGGRLSAIRLEDRRVYQVSCPPPAD